jgi:FlgD Ig-like domain
MGTPLVRAAFAALLLATLAAFFLAQQLKGEFPLVLRFAATPDAISPNGDDARDRSVVGFDLSRKAKVSFSILDSDGNEVRRLVDNRLLKGDRKYRFIWDGRDSSGKVVPDGTYHMRVIRRDEGRVINSLKDVTVDTRRPRVRLVSARPGLVVGARTRVRIRYRGPQNKAPEVRMFRTDGGPTRVVSRFRGNKSRSATWNGIIRGHPAADGDYAFTVTVRDRAGNVAVAPQEIPTAASAGAGTGVAVRRLDLTGPLGIVRAGSVARLEARPGRRSFSFALSRADSTRAVRRGRRSGNALRLRLPRRARTGVYVVRVRAAGRRAAWPLAVRGVLARRARPPLVVLPAITWQGQNPVDDDLDGFAGTLDTSRSIPLARPLARGRLPAGFRSQSAPLLRFLDRERLPYDLTTDLSLARGRGPSLSGAPGVVFAGSERWLPTDLEGKLRAYVEDGGRLASFGADAFHRGVRLTSGALAAPTGRLPRDAFGERTSLVHASPPAPLVVGKDRLALFPTGSLGEFSVFERSTGVPPPRRVLSAAGREAASQDFVAYRLGRGTVVRVGTPEWSRQLSAAGVAAVTRRLWRLVSGGRR